MQISYVVQGAIQFQRTVFRESTHWKCSTRKAQKHTTSDPYNSRFFPLPRVEGTNVSLLYGKPLTWIIW